jgi:hypothetical protein
MAESLADFILPSDPKSRADIVDTIHEMVGQSRDIKDKRSYITDAKKRLKADYGLSPKIASKMVKTIQEQNFKDTVAESEAFAETYEILFERGTPAPRTVPTDSDE